MRDTSNDRHNMAQQPSVIDSRIVMGINTRDIEPVTVDAPPISLTAPEDILASKIQASKTHDTIRATNYQSEHEVVGRECIDLVDFVKAFETVYGNYLDNWGQFTVAYKAYYPKEQHDACDKAIVAKYVRPNYKNLTETDHEGLERIPNTYTAFNVIEREQGLAMYNARERSKHGI